MRNPDESAEFLSVLRTPDISSWEMHERITHEAAVRQQRLVPDGRFAMFRSGAPIEIVRDCTNWI